MRVEDCELVKKRCTSSLSLFLLSTYLEQRDGVSRVGRDELERRLGLLDVLRVKGWKRRRKGRRGRVEAKKTNKQCSPAVVVASPFDFSFSPLLTLSSPPRKRQQTHGVARERLHERLPSVLTSGSASMAFSMEQRKREQRERWSERWRFSFLLFLLCSTSGCC